MLGADQTDNDFVDPVPRTIGFESPAEVGA